MSVSRRDAPKVRREIMEALGIRSRAGWVCRLNGSVEPKVSEAQAIADIFKSYGVLDVWGDE